MKDLKGNSSYLIDQMNREKRSAFNIRIDLPFIKFILIGSWAADSIAIGNFIGFASRFSGYFQKRKTT